MLDCKEYSFFSKRGCADLAVNFGGQLAFQVLLGEVCYGIYKRKYLKIQLFIWEI